MPTPLTVQAKVEEGDRGQQQQQQRVNNNNNVILHNDGETERSIPFTTALPHFEIY